MDEDTDTRTLPEHTVYPVAPACSGSAVPAAKDAAVTAVAVEHAGVGRAEIDGCAGAAQAPAVVAAGGHVDSAVASLSSARRHRYGDDSLVAAVCSSLPSVSRRGDADGADSASDSCTRTRTTCAAVPPTGRSGKTLFSGWTNVAVAPVPLATPVPRSSRSPSSCGLAAETARFAAPLCRGGPSRGRRLVRSCLAATCALGLGRSSLSYRAYTSANTSS